MLTRGTGGNWMSRALSGVAALAVAVGLTPSCSGGGGGGAGSDGGASSSSSGGSGSGSGGSSSGGGADSGSDATVHPLVGQAGGCGAQVTALACQAPLGFAPNAASALGCSPEPGMCTASPRIRRSAHRAGTLGAAAIPATFFARSRTTVRPTDGGYVLRTASAYHPLSRRLLEAKSGHRSRVAARRGSARTAT
jgi:hypothetical protein